MTGKPRAIVLLDETVSHLRNTLRRYEDVVPPSMTATICGFLSHWGRAVHQGATVIAPGKEKIAEWSRCSVRQVQYNLAPLRNWGFLQVVDHEQGGRHRKTAYALNIVALINALDQSGVRLHRTLVDKLREEARKGAIKGAAKGAMAAPFAYISH